MRIPVLLLSSCLLASQLHATESIKALIKDDIARGDNEHLCMVLQEVINKEISFNEIKNFAFENKLYGLYKEAVATKELALRKEQLGISKGQFIACAHYINTVANDITTYYPKEMTGLTHTIEFDPKTKKYFVVIDDDKAYLGRGHKKTVSKAICYDKKKAHIVARACQTKEMDLELQLTKQLQGSLGLFKTIAFTSYIDNGVRYYAIYSELYTAGSLKDVFTNDYDLTLYEKAFIARDLASGLKTLHNQGLVHRDLGIKNYLLSIPEGEPGRRKIESCIADFGRMMYAKDIMQCDLRLQGNTSYMAPEGHYYPTGADPDHYKLDVFALGCVYYRLFYDQKPDFQRVSYVNDPRPLDERFVEHFTKVEKVTKKRKLALASKELSPKEEFEYLILSMLDTNPKVRPDASQIHSSLQEIVKQLP